MRFFSIKESLGFGWVTFKKNWKFLLGVSAVAGIIGIFPQIVSGFIPGDFWYLSLAISLVLGVIQITVAVGMLIIMLDLVDNKTPAFSDLFSHYSLFLKYFSASVLAGLAVSLGFILLIVPGVILSIKFMFWPYFIVDQKLGPIAALKASWHLTAGFKWKLFLLGLVLGLINILGIVLLLIGSLVTGPVTALALVSVYRKLHSLDNQPGVIIAT